MPLPAFDETKPPQKPYSMLIPRYKIITKEKGKTRTNYYKTKIPVYICKELGRTPDLLILHEVRETKNQLHIL